MAHEQRQINFTVHTDRAFFEYKEAGVKENVSGRDGINVQFTPTQKEAIVSYVQKHGLKQSAFIRDMLDLTFEFHPYREKIVKHKDLLQVFLDRLS